MIIQANSKFVNSIRKSQQLDDPHAIYVENKESSHLLIMFGYRYGKFTSPRTADNLKVNALYFRCNYGTYYLEPYAHGATPKEVAENINKFVEERPHIKTITVTGSSAGGFAALLYSPWLKYDKIVAYVPQTIFPHFSGRPVITPMHDNVMCSDEFLEYVDIVEVWKKYGMPKNKIILRAPARYIESEYHRDLEEAQRLTFCPAVELIVHDAEGHKGLDPILNDSIHEYEQSLLV